MMPLNAGVRASSLANFTPFLQRCSPFISRRAGVAGAIVPLTTLDGTARAANGQDHSRGLYGRAPPASEASYIETNTVRQVSRHVVFRAAGVI